jgi:hypothetical protein
MLIYSLDFVFFFQFNVLVSLKNKFTKYRCAPVSVGNMFQDLLQLRETADNPESYI